MLVNRSICVKWYAVSSVFLLWCSALLRYILLNSRLSVRWLSLWCRLGVYLLTNRLRFIACNRLIL